MTEPEMVDYLAKILAEYDGCMIVEMNSMAVGGWITRMEPSLPEPASREDYEREAGRFLHLFQAAAFLVREQRGYV